MHTHMALICLKQSQSIKSMKNAVGYSSHKSLWLLATHRTRNIIGNTVFFKNRNIYWKNESKIHSKGSNYVNKFHSFFSLSATGLKDSRWWRDTTPSTPQSETTTGRSPKLHLTNKSVLLVSIVWNVHGPASYSAN